VNAGEWRGSGHTENVGRNVVWKVWKVWRRGLWLDLNTLYEKLLRAFFRWGGLSLGLPPHFVLFGCWGAGTHSSFQVFSFQLSFALEPVCMGAFANCDNITLGP